MVTFEVKANRVYSENNVVVVVVFLFLIPKQMKQKRFYTVKSNFNKSNQ